jgi:hypothetical protein
LFLGGRERVVAQGSSRGSVTPFSTIERPSLNDANAIAPMLCSNLSAASVPDSSLMCAISTPR